MRWPSDSEERAGLERKLAEEEGGLAASAEEEAAPEV